MSLSERTKQKGEAVLANSERGIFAYLPFLGPAIIASVAYMDPGNFATNIQSGAQYGYMLLWVVLLANLIAMLFQSLSARMGIVTGKSLAELSREQFPRPVTYAMWVGSELAAIATDVAEVLGGAVAIMILFHVPLMVGALITGIVTYLVLSLQEYGFRPMELVIGAFVATISLSYVAELFIAPPVWGSLFFHTIVPHIAGPESILLAVGIVGATVMPHALYLHSSLTKDRIPTRNDEEKRRVITFSNHEVLFALGAAGIVNMAMVAMSAVVFNTTGHSAVASIESAYHTLVPLFGSFAALIFLLSLLASGISSSVVGTMAGQTIMQDFVPFRIPLLIRRIVTIAPVFVLIWMGVDTTRALVMSQVVLSLALPIPMIALVYLTARQQVMGVFANSRVMNIVAFGATVVVLLLNVLLVVQTLLM